jgi:hypothetical protein
MRFYFPLRRVFLIVFFGLFPLVLIGQNIVNFPSTRALFPRNCLNKGYIKVEVDNWQTPELRFKLYKDGIVLSDETVSTISQHYKNDSIEIVAGLHFYKIELYDKNGPTENIVLSADSIVCGDIFLVNGQSNSTYGTITNTDFLKNDFLVTYKDNWQKATSKETSIGDLGMNLGNSLITELGIPICILSEGLHSQRIGYFKPNQVNHLDLSTNYGRVLNKLNNLGFKDYIKGLIWFQGESDSHPDQSLFNPNYKEDLDTLYSAWKIDLPQIYKYYIYQIRPGCYDYANIYTKKYTFIQQAQYLISEEHDDVFLVSTNFAAHAGCHYDYYDGYERLGDRLFKLIKHHFYNYPLLPNDVSPYPGHVWVSGFNQISAQILPIDATLSIENHPEIYVQSNESYWINSWTIESGNILVMNFATNSSVNFNVNAHSNIIGIGFDSHPENSSPGLHNSNNIGIISRYNIPLSDCPGKSLFLSGNISNGNLKFETERFIESTQIIPLLGVNSSLTYNAQNYITLKPGFEINPSNSSFFLTELTGCP